MMPSPTFGIPDRRSPLSTFEDRQGNTITTILSDNWYRFLTRLQQQSAERPIQVLSPGASPFEYEATCIGNLCLTGGSGVVATLTRGSTSVTVAGGLIPMAAGDIVSVAFGGAPSASFIPGART